MAALGYFKFNPQIHHRRSIRLPKYDYSQAGMYFITICVQDGETLFGKVENNKVVLNEFGDIVRNEINRTAEIRENVEIQPYIIMPNHVHMVICIYPCRGGLPSAQMQTYESNQGDRQVAPTVKYKTIGTILAGFKSTTAKQINVLREIPRAPVWQRNYYEHVIRDEKSYNKIVEYTLSNPYNWDQDEHREQDFKINDIIL